MAGATKKSRDWNPWIEYFLGKVCSELRTWSWILLVNSGNRCDLTVSRWKYSYPFSTRSLTNSEETQTYFVGRFAASPQFVLKIGKCTLNETWLDHGWFASGTADVFRGAGIAFIKGFVVLLPRTITNIPQKELQHTEPPFWGQRSDGFVAKTLELRFVSYDSIFATCNNFLQPAFLEMNEGKTFFRPGLKPI